MVDQIGATNSGYYAYDPAFPENSEWRYISETWCNLQGRYTHIVKDYTSIYPLSLFYEVSLCSVGVMGTKYVRDTAVTPTVAVVEGQVASFDVEHIYSQILIGNTLAISLRQNAGSA